MSEIFEFNENPNIWSKYNEPISYLPELNHPAIVLGEKDKQYADIFEAYEDMLKKHAAEYFLIHLN